MAEGRTHAGLLPVEGEEGEIDKTTGEQAGGKRVDAEDARERWVGSGRYGRMRLGGAAGKQQARGEQGQQGGRAGQGQAQERGAVVVKSGDHRGHEQRSDDGAGLIERGVQAEAPAVADFGGRAGKQNVAGGAAQALAGALGDDEGGGHRPVQRKSQQRNGDHGESIAEDGEGPVGAGAVGQAAGEEAQAGGQHFAETGDEADLGGVGAEILEEGAEDAARALIRHVGKQADHAEAEDETQRGGAGIGGMWGVGWAGHPIYGQVTRPYFLTSRSRSLNRPSPSKISRLRTEYK